MHLPLKYPGHIKFTRNTFAVIAAALLGYRIIRAADVSITDAITSTLTGVALIGATALGYLHRVRELRGEAAAKAQEAAAAKRGKRLAEQEILRLREVARQQSQQTSEQQAREEEERSWWATNQTDHDTIAFGQTVVPLDLRRRLNERDLY